MDLGSWVLLGGVVLTAVFVLWRSSAAEYDGPEEPYLDWDGVIPDEVAAPMFVGGAWIPAVDYPGALEVSRQRPSL